jgi:hypothetical protein
MTDTLLDFGFILVVAAGGGWQVRRLWGHQALAAYVIGGGIGILMGILIGRN